MPPPGRPPARPPADRGLKGIRRAPMPWGVRRFALLSVLIALALAGAFAYSAAGRQPAAAAPAAPAQAPATELPPLPAGGTAKVVEPVAGATASAVAAPREPADTPLPTGAPKPRRAASVS